MPFVQKKNAVLADRRFARHESELKRLRKEVGSQLWSYFVTSAGMGAVFAGDAIRKALKAFVKRYRRHYGLSGVTYKPNGERECARRLRQIERGILNEANGLYRGELVAGCIPDHARAR